MKSAAPSPRNPERILVMSQFYYPDITAAAFRIKETVDLLVAKGYRVHVIAARPHKAQIAGERIDDGPVQVSRVPIIPYAGKGKWNYIAHYLSFMAAAIWASWSHPSRFDIVWASSPPMFTGIAGWIVAKLKKAKLVLDVRDIWPDSAATTGQIRPDSLMFSLAKHAERWMYRAADRITCVAGPMAKYIESYGVRAPAVVYNAIPRSYLDAAEAVSREVGPDSPVDRPLTVAYVGNMGYCQSLDIVVEAAARLHAAGDRRIRFLLVGEGAEKAKIEARIREAGLDNVEMRGAVPKAEALRICASATALVLLLKDDGTMDKTIPSKVFDYLAAGRPILFGLQGESREILGTSGGNIPFDAGDPDSLVAALRTLAGELPRLTAAAAGHRDLVRARFMRETMTDRLEAEFRKLLHDSIPET
ncbi:MAG TPA: glycosyltransferase family 4 protein [Candidatus Ozemobacteraceae bacterium]